MNLFHAPISAAALAAEDSPGNCPTCNLSGTTPEQVAREAPRWMAALTALAPRSQPVPDEPRLCCWSCREMIAAGLDPAAIIAPDHADYRAAHAR